ncbi:MAG: glycosyltransferase N-terminal domain-containing protein [Planctomycetota bacterium]
MPTPLDAAYLLLGAITAPWWMRKQRGGWSERFGKIEHMLTGAAKPAGRPRILIHAVSVGETAALRTLVPILLETHDVVISTTTDTGLARARALYEDRCPIVRYPLDASWAVRRFLDSVRPDAVALTELEVWPQFVKACTKRGIPVAVINGRLSANSFKGYRRFRPLIGPTFRRLAAVGAQDDTIAARFREMGAAKVTVTGSMKWDNAAATATDEDERAAADIAQSLGIDRGRPLVVAGSTGPGEEALLAKAIEPIEGAQLLCAPRKPERFDEAASALTDPVRRSDPKPRDDTRHYLLDTLGELRAAYLLADVVVMGRTFPQPDTKPLGGSDPTEPAGLGKPVLLGPDVANFASVVETLESAHAVARTSVERLTDDLRRLLACPGDLGSSARDCVQAQLGASRRTAELIKSLL